MRIQAINNSIVYNVDSGHLFPNYPQLLLAVAAVVLCQAAVCAQDRTRPTCDAPAYFGICDPFVPGTFIRTDKTPFLVVDTWPHGPAEKAGICPGDQIIAINGILAHEHTSQRMLRELVATSAIPVQLRVRRGERELEFSVPRVRESTLAYLSDRVFLRGKLAPAGQTPGGLEALESLTRRAYARSGLKPMGRLLVPLDAPEEHARYLAELLDEAWELERLPTEWRVPRAQERDAYAPGLRVVLLKDPDEVWVYEVAPNSPAHSARIFPGDQLLEVDGRPASAAAPASLATLLTSGKQPRPITFKVRRGNAVWTAELTTQRLRDFLPSSIGAKRVPTSAGGRSSQDHVVGLWVRYDENLPEAVVEDVEYPSPAFRAGIHLGDKILAINGTPLEKLTPEQLGSLLAPTQPVEVVLDVLRAKARLRMQLQAETYAESLARIRRRVTKAGGSVPQHCADPPD